MAEIVITDDLPTAIRSAELVEAMVAGVNAQASRVAPCLTWTGTPTDQPVPSDDQLAEAKLVLIGAIKRWVEAGSGALQQQSAGPYAMSVDTRPKSTGWRLWPSEIEQLQDICADGNDNTTGAFSIIPTPSVSNHAPWCDLMFGGLDCSCGLSLSGGDWIYEPA